MKGLVGEVVGMKRTVAVAMAAGFMALAAVAAGLAPGTRS